MNYILERNEIIMNLQLKNKMTNILSSICMISTPKQYKLDKIKEIVNDNKLTESVPDEINKKIEGATNPDDLINILKEIAAEDTGTFDKLIEKIEKNQENINQEDSKIDTKNKMIEKLSKFLDYIKTNLSKKNLNELAKEIEKQSTELHKHYKENDNKSYTHKWLKNIVDLRHNNLNSNEHEKEYLQNLRKELSKKPKLFEGFGAAVSNKQVQKNLKELIKKIDEKIKAYS